MPILRKAKLKILLYLSLRLGMKKVCHSSKNIITVCIDGEVISEATVPDEIKGVRICLNVGEGYESLMGIFEKLTSHFS